MNLAKYLEQAFFNHETIGYSVVTTGYSYYDVFTLDDFQVEDDGAISLSSEDRSIFITKPELFNYIEEAECFERIEGEVKIYIE